MPRHYIRIQFEFSEVAGLFLLWPGNEAIISLAHSWLFSEACRLNCLSMHAQ